MSIATTVLGGTARAESDCRELRQSDRWDRIHGTAGEAVASRRFVRSGVNVSPGTVTGMLKTLSESDLATYTPYEGARLTPAGQRLAMKVIRGHRLLELFLVQTLRMPWDEVHEEAENMEHAASERLIDRIDAFLGHPTVDPHGDPIPRADGSLPAPEGIPMSTLTRGQRFRVVRVVDQDPAFLRYLSECGLDLHAMGELVENRPEARALIFRLNNGPVAAEPTLQEKYFTPGVETWERGCCPSCRVAPSRKIATSRAAAKMTCSSAARVNHAPRSRPGPLRP